MIQRTALAKYRLHAPVHGCFGGGNSCDMRHLFVVDSLDEHIQNEKEFILASAGVRGFLYLCGEY